MGSPFTQIPENYCVLQLVAFVETGFGFYPKTSFGLHVQMLWTVSFWRGCLGNESNDICIPVKCVSKNV